MEKQFERVVELIGNESFQKISSKAILLVGVGGVGGSVLECLVRSGFNNITILDSDNIDITNLNRQIFTNLENVSLSKVDASKTHALTINKDVKINAIKTFLDDSNINEIFNNKYDYCFDCIDSVSSKILLFKKCLETNTKLISCCGTANKLDPTKIEITKLSKTKDDKLAKRLRELCKREQINMDKINVVYSTERPYTDITKPLPSMMMVPTAAAMAMVSFVIKDII